MVFQVSGGGHLEGALLETFLLFSWAAILDEKKGQNSIASEQEETFVVFEYQIRHLLAIPA